MTKALYGESVGLVVMVLLGSLSGLAATAQGVRGDLVCQYVFALPQMASVTVDGVRYDTVSLSNAAVDGRVGEPGLPACGAYILLPAGTGVESISVSGVCHLVGTGFHVMPVEQPVPVDAGARPLVMGRVYGSDEFSPGCLFSVVGVQVLRGFSVLVLALHPVQYRPLSGELVAYDSLEVTVSLSSSSLSSLFRGLPQDFEAVESRVDNPSVVSSYPSRGSSGAADLLILTTDVLRGSFEVLAAAHNATGTGTIVRTLADVGGNDTEAIRDFIRVQYSTLGISYVLLGGDDGVVPKRLLWVQGMDENVTPYEDFMPADLYYGCLDGPYNGDGDDKWGEPNDGLNGGDVDLLAEVYVGRACVDTPLEAQAFVEKTILYMRSVNDSYRSTMLLAGEYLGDYGIASYGSSYLEQLVNGSSADGYSTVGIPASVYRIDRLYDEDHAWTNQEMIAKINAGVHFLNHLGHANFEYNMKMVIPDVQGLTNTKYCFVYSQGCMSGGFDQGDCIAEYFTAKSTHGAVAGVWNARYGFFWSFSTDGDSQRLHRQFWDAVFGENKTTVGAANHDSKEDNLFIINRSCIRWVYYETNLFGDPAIDLIGGGSPPLPELTIDAVKGGFRRIQVTVTNTGELPLSGMSWSVQVQGGIRHRINLMVDGDPLSLGVDESQTASAVVPVFGLGPVSVSLNVPFCTPWVGTGVALGPFLVKVQPSR